MLFWKKKTHHICSERYRELIEAADTIASMKQSAASVLSHLGQMEKLCSSLETSSLQEKDKEDASIRERVWVMNRSSYFVFTFGSSHLGLIILFGSRVQQMAYYAVASQIRLLMDIPEALWASVESRHFLTGTQLYLLAREVYHGLILLLICLFSCLTAVSLSWDLYWDKWECHKWRCKCVSLNYCDPFDLN